jgi:hypothetical protein
MSIPNPVKAKLRVIKRQKRAKEFALNSNGTGVVSKVQCSGENASDRVLIKIK